MAWAQQPAPEDSPFSPVPPATDERRQFRFVEALPEFEAKDLNGRRWTLSDLKGRVTLLYIWAPLCLPCIRDTPLIQRQFERAAGKDAVQVLTISPHEAREFMTARKYTFPVIMSFQLEPRLLPAWATTAVYVVDREGRRTESLRSWPLGKVMIEAERLSARSTGTAAAGRP